LAIIISRSTRLTWRVGDNDVRLFQARDAFAAAEVASFRKGRAGVEILLQEELDVFDAGRAVSSDILHFLDLEGQSLGPLALAVSLVILSERQLPAGDRRAVVAGGDELFKPELVEVGGEVLEKVALEGVVAIAVDDLAAEGVGVEFEVGLDLFLDVNVLSVELVLLRRLRGVQPSIHRLLSMAQVASLGFLDGHCGLTNQAERTRPASVASGSKILLKPIVRWSKLLLLRTLIPKDQGPLAL
jgi:hypothetical protein